MTEYNPYESPHSATADVVVGDIGSRKIQVRPLGRLSDATKLMGDQYLLFVLICFVGIFLGSIVPFYILLGPMVCGIHLCFDDRARGLPTTFERLFKGFDFFLPSFVAILLMILMIFIIVLPLWLCMMFGIFAILSAADGNEDFIAAAFGIGFIPVIVVFSFLMMLVYIPFLFVFALIVDQRLTAWEAIKASWSGASKNLWGLWGMMLLYWLIGTVCAMMCYLPAFLVMPLQFGGFYLVYRDIFPTCFHGLSANRNNVARANRHNRAMPRITSERGAS